MHENEQKRYLIQTGYQAKSSGSILLKVPGIDKGVDPNVISEKLIMKPVATPQTHVATESEDHYHLNQD